MEVFEFMLHSGDIDLWYGKTWEDAAKDYVKQHPGTIITAWRYYPETNFIVANPKLENVRP